MRSFVALLGLLALVLVPSAALAQTNSSISGEVADNTGGILPGVTVEASSPALIEGSRVAITDGAGLYTFVDLRPGTYSLSFTLPGFSTVIRNELVLQAAFTMNIDAEMNVGGIEETVTVSGEAPVVDVQSTRQVEVLDREVLDSIPTGRNMQSTGQLIVGIKLNRPEVGLSTSAQQTVMMTHGMSWRQVSVAVDGQLVNGTDRDGGIQNYHNHLANEEMAYETSGMTAETSGGGVRINMIPREGGNTLAGQFYTGFSNNALANDHTVVPSSQATYPNGGTRATGSEGNTLFHDINIAQGGPLVRDKLWFFASARRWQVDKPITGSFYRNQSGTAPRYFDHDPVPLDGKGGRELLSGIDANTIKSTLIRLTYQAGANHKLSAYFDRIFKDRYRPHGAGDDPATAPNHQGSPIYYTGAAKWTATLSNRLLLEAGYSSNVENWSYEERRDAPPLGPAVGLRQSRPTNVPFCAATPCYHVGNTAAQQMQYGSGMDPWYQMIRRNDTDAAFRDRGNWSYIQEKPERFNYNVSLTYVTGSHNMKVGVMNSWGIHHRSHSNNGDMWEQKYKDAVPYEARVSNLPIWRPMNYNKDMGIYAQDTWTIDRLTLNLGVRWETMLGENLPSHRQQNRFVPSAQYQGLDNLPNWSDIAPRLGLAYDVFGDASTALKFSWGRYNGSNTTSYSRQFNPVTHTGENRSWFDCALNPANDTQCATQAQLTALGFDPTIAYGTSTTDASGAVLAGTGHNGGTNGDDYVQDWEIGTPVAADYGQFSTIPTADPNGVERPWVSLMNIGIEREITTGFSMQANWYHRESYDPILQYNRAYTTSDWTALQFPNPCAATGSASNGFPCSTRGITPDAQLTIYNLNPSAKGRTSDNFMRNSSSNADSYNGFDVSFNARLAGGAAIFGGWTMERNFMNRCDQPSDPNRLLFCDASKYDIPWLHDFKISGTVPLPGGIQFSGSAQFYPAQEMTAGGSTSLFGGTNQGGSTFDDLQAYAGNVNYSVSVADFAAQGVTRTQGLGIALMPPGSLFADTLTQIDVSIRKSFNLPNGIRWDVQADVYNVPNYFPIIQMNKSFGSSMGKASRTINRRFLQLATHLHW
jgi:hypothetical protein